MIREPLLKPYGVRKLPSTVVTAVSAVATADRLIWLYPDFSNISSIQLLLFMVSVEIGKLALVRG